MAKTILVALMGEPDHILNGQRSEGARGRWCGAKARRSEGDCRLESRTGLAPSLDARRPVIVDRGPGLTPGELSRT